MGLAKSGFAGDIWELLEPHAQLPQRRLGATHEVPGWPIQVWGPTSELGWPKLESPSGCQILAHATSRAHASPSFQARLVMRAHKFNVNWLRAHFLSSDPEGPRTKFVGPPRSTSSVDGLQGQPQMVGPFSGLYNGGREMRQRRVQRVSGALTYRPFTSSYEERRSSSRAEAF